MSLLEQIGAVEASLDDLSQHIANVPKAEILAARLLVHVGRELASMVDQRVRQFGLSEIEFRTLMNVYVHSCNNRSAYPGELCASLGGQSPANLTRLSDSLVQRGFIERLPDAQDRRRLGLRTTKAGNDKVDAILPLMMAPMRQNFADVPRQDLDQLIQILKRVAEAMDRSQAEVTP